MEEYTAPESNEVETNSSRLKDLAAQLQSLESEVHDLRAQSGNEFDGAYNLIARSLGRTSVMTNALIEIIELDNK